MAPVTNRAGRLQRFAFAVLVRPFLAFWIGARVIGRENLPVQPPYLLVANHSSHLDTVLILSMLPGARLRELRPVAAADYFMRNGLVFWVTRTFFNILPIPRSGITRENNPLTLMTQALDDGFALLLFPEGTRVTDDAEEMQRFQTGIAHLVEERPDIPIVPIWVEGARRSMPKGSMIPVPIFCELHLGPPRHVTGTRKEIIATLEAAVLDLKGA